MDYIAQLSFFVYLSCSFQRQAEVSPEVPTHKLIVDEEFLPFKDNSLDIVFSSLRYLYN